MSIQKLFHYLLFAISTLEFSLVYVLEKCRIYVHHIFLRLSSEGWPKRTESHEDLLNQPQFPARGYESNEFLMEFPTKHYEFVT